MARDPWKPARAAVVSDWIWDRADTAPDSTLKMLARVAVDWFWRAHGLVARWRAGERLCSSCRGSGVMQVGPCDVDPCDYCTGGTVER